MIDVTKLSSLEPQQRDLFEPEKDLVFVKVRDAGISVEHEAGDGASDLSGSFQLYPSDKNKNAHQLVGFGETPSRSLLKPN